MYDNHETADVTGGTGRFTSATGHWESGGQVDFTTEPLRVFCYSRGSGVDLNVNRLRRRHVDIVRLICASQLAFV